ncbi:MAG: tRNA modification radical SAM protein MnmL/YtqA, partial [Planctomycetota bacterium]
KYGHPLYRIPIDLGFGCPNRRDSGSGCIFCPEDGARAQQIRQHDDIEMQVLTAVSFAKKRYKAKEFIAYFQAFSNTFADISVQRELYKKVLSLSNFKSVSIGTRPDCLPCETLEFLEELNKDYDLWVELGVQTIHNKTLEVINRGHTWEESLSAVEKLKERGIKTALHVILGLPCETIDDMMKTAEEIAALNIYGIKIHNLHVIKNTELEKEYEKGKVKVLNEHEYADLLIEFLRRIPAGLPVIRLITDTPEEDLVAPVWDLSKGQFEEFLIYQMKCRQVRQGDLFSTENTRVENNSFKISETSDESITFWSDDYKEHFHAKIGAYSEALSKFIKPSGITDMLARGNVRLLDICFGLGYNAFAAAGQAVDVQSGKLSIDALEMDKRVVDTAKESVYAEELKELDCRQLLSEIYSNGKYDGGYFNINMHWGDARQTISELKYKYNIVFMDPFSTQRNSELWTIEFIEKIKNVLIDSGVVVTYSSALPVRSAFLKAGFYVGNISAYGNDRAGTIAAMQADIIDEPIGLDELDFIQKTSRGIPYRDPNGILTNKTILQHRQREVELFNKKALP